MEARPAAFEAETLLSVSQALGTTLDLTEVLRRVARETARAFGADAAGAFLADADEAELRPVAAYHVPSPLRELGTEFAIALRGHPFFEEAWTTRRPIAATDADADARLSPELRARVPARSLLFVPMLAKEAPIGGLLLAWWTEARVLTAQELRLVEGIGRQAGLAVANARLFAAQQEDAEVARALLTLAEATGALQELGRVLDTVAWVTPQLLGLRRCGVFLWEAATSRLVPTAAWGLAPELAPAFAALAGSPRIPVVLRAIESREPVVVDAAAVPTAIPAHIVESLDIRSILVLPLVASDRLMGTMAVDSPGVPHVFTAKQIAIARGVAAHAAVAIHNAALFTEKTRAHDELRSAQEQLIRSEKLRALGEMAAGVAHDFNNVLAAIMGRAQLLLTQMEEPGQRRQLQIIERAAMDGARTVRRIQEFTRMRRDRPFEPVDLNQVVEEVVEVTRSRWKDDAVARGISYEVRVEPTALPLIAADPSELREVVTNLVLNALDAMPDGGRVTLTTSVDRETVVCAVTDTGIGMTEEVRQRVFDPFFTTKAEKGTGLGLSMAYGIVTRHGGEIEVRSRPWHGSSFSIRLPVARPPATPPARPGDSGPVVPARVLVIDDEENVRQVLAELLMAQGHTVAAHADGRSGLARFHDEPFDVVFTDLGMPGLSGWEVARVVKLRRPATPVVLVTGWSDQMEPDEVRRRGIDFVVAKPFEATTIRSVLGQALASRRA